MTLSTIRWSATNGESEPSQELRHTSVTSSWSGKRLDPPVLSSRPLGSLLIVVDFEAFGPADHLLPTSTDQQGPGDSWRWVSTHFLRKQKNQIKTPSNANAATPPTCTCLSATKNLI